LESAVLLDLGDERSLASLGRLHDETEAPVSARLPWIGAWAESHPSWTPWVLALRDGTNELRAVASLARSGSRGLVLIRALGHTGLDRAPVVFRTNEDGAELARALAGALREVGPAWELHIRQLPSGCVFLNELARALDLIEVRDGSLRPTVELAGVQDPREVLSRNLRQAENKARNRIARAGLAFEERWISDPDAIAARIPELRAVHHARDVQLRGSSLLDDPRESAYYDALVRRHLPQLEMFELRLSGELAAYVLLIRNGRVRVVLDNRVSPSWTAFSAGLIANNSALRAAALDPTVRTLDWGAGAQRYKLQSASSS
jgi:hypothetical protein